MHFIGIDLAWKPKKLRTAFAVLDSNCVLVEDRFVTTDEEMLSSVASNIGKGVLVGIDAPLSVLEKTRSCEVILRSCGIPVLPVSKKIFERYYGGMRGVKLRNMFNDIGIPLIYRLDRGKRVNGLMEIYPYASWIIAFNWKFKTGKKLYLKERRLALKGMRSRLFSMTPCIKEAENLRFHVQNADIESMGSADLTAMNDMLDAIIGAYTLFVYWKFGSERAVTVGKREGGTILTLADKKLKTKLKFLSSNKHPLP